MGRKKKFKISYSKMKEKKQNEKLQAAIQKATNANVPTINPASQANPYVPHGGEGSVSRSPAGQSTSRNTENSDDHNTKTCIDTENPISPEYKNAKLLLLVQQNINDKDTQSLVVAHLTALLIHWQSSTMEMNYISRCLSDVEQAYGQFVKLQTITFNVPHQFNLMTLFQLKHEQLRLQQKIDYVRDHFFIVDQQYLLKQDETLEMFDVFELFRLDAEQKRLAILMLFKELDELDHTGYILQILMSKDFNLDAYIKYSPIYDAQVEAFYRKEKASFITHQIAHIYLIGLRDKLLPIKYMINRISQNLDIARVKLISFKTKCYQLRISRSEFLKRQGLRHYEIEVLTIVDAPIKLRKNDIKLISPEDFRELVETEYNTKPKAHPTETVKVPVETTDAITSTASMETNIVPTIIHANTTNVDNSFPNLSISDDHCATPPYITEYDKLSVTPTDILLSHQGTNPMIAFMKSDDYKTLEHVPDSKKKQDTAPEANKSNNIPAIDLAVQGSSNLPYEPDGDVISLDGQSTPTDFDYSDDDRDTVILSPLGSSQETLVCDFTNIDERCDDFLDILNVPADTPPNAFLDLTNSDDYKIPKKLPASKKSETSNTINSKIKRRKSCKQRLRSPPPPVPEIIEDYAPEVKSGQKVARKGRKKKQNKSHKNNGNESITNMNPLSNNKALDDNKHEIDLSQAGPSDKKSINKNLAAGIDLSVGKPNEHISIEEEFTNISLDEEIAYGIDFSLLEADILEAPYFETIANESLVQYASIQSVTASSANAYMNNIKNNSKEAHEQGQLQNESTDDELIVHFTPEYFNEHEKQDIPKNKGKRTRGIKTKSILHRKPELVEEIQHNEVEPVELAAGDHKDKNGESIDKDQYPNQSVENEQMCPETKKQEDKEAIVKATVEVRDRLAETLSLLMTADFNLEEFILEHLTSDAKLNEFLGREEPISAHEVAILFLKHFQDTISQHKQPTQRKLENLAVEKMEYDIETCKNTSDETILQDNNQDQIQSPTQADTNNSLMHKQTYDKVMSKIKVLSYEKKPDMLPELEEKSELVKKKKRKRSKVLHNLKPTVEVEAETSQTVSGSTAIETQIEEVTIDKRRKKKIPIDNSSVVTPQFKPDQPILEVHPSELNETITCTNDPEIEHIPNLEPYQMHTLHTSFKTVHFTEIKSRQKRKMLRYEKKPEILPELEKKSELVKKKKRKRAKVLQNIKPTVKVEAGTSQTGSQIEEVAIDKLPKDEIPFENSSTDTPQFKPDQPILELHPSELNEPTICTKDPEIEHTPELEPHQVEISDLQASIASVHIGVMKSKRRPDSYIDLPAFKVKVKRRPVLQPETARPILGTQVEETPVPEETSNVEVTSAIIAHRHKRLGKFTDPIFSTRSVRILDQRKVHDKDQPAKEKKDEVTEKQKKDTKNKEINNKKGKGYKYMKMGKQK